MVQPSNIVTLAGKCTNKLKLLDRLLAVYLRLRYQELVNHKRVVNLLILKSVGLQCRLVVYETVDPDTNFLYNLRYYFSLSSLNNNSQWVFSAVLSSQVKEHIFYQNELFNSFTVWLFSC